MKTLTTNNKNSNLLTLKHNYTTEQTFHHIRNQIGKNKLPTVMK